MRCHAPLKNCQNGFGTFLNSLFFCLNSFSENDKSAFQDAALVGWRVSTS